MAADAAAAGASPALERTVGTEIAKLFPRGLLATEDDDIPDWSVAPLFPMDLFAVAAYLLEASGAYQYVVAPFATAAVGRSGLSYEGPTRAPTQREIDRWTDIGRRWATDWRILESDIQPYWDQLWSARSDRLVVTPKGTTRPRWWKYAHALLVIADEASDGMGYTLPGDGDEFDPDSTAPLRWANLLNSRRLSEETRRYVLPAASATVRTGEHISRHVALDSLTQDASREVVRVLPKGRTAALGCTPRTLSHNLALLPPHGRSNAYWHQPRLEAEAISRVGEEMNLLLVPFPYRVPDGCFVGEKNIGVNGDGPWGRFTVSQEWLRTGEPDSERQRAANRRSLVDFVDALIAQAEADGTVVNGVIFPELALDWTTYDAVARTLLRERPSIEILMAGVSQDCNGTSGNLVTTSLFHSIDGRRFVETHSRMKHHRWCLDNEQIRSYGLEHELDPDLVWWEFLHVGERVIHIDVVRQSTMTAVICEDLARVDPGLAELRLLGPNLVVALLMDGPQLKGRWPGRYATALAEDPGSSVLTFTSLGLVQRSNAFYKSTKQVIGLWRNYPQRNAPNGTVPVQELELGAGAHAVLLSLSSEKASESTLDGRPNSDAVAWIHKAHRDVSISETLMTTNSWDWIVK